MCIRDSFGGDGASGLGQVAKTLSAFFDELAIVDLQLAEQHWDKLVDVVDDLGLARYMQDLVQGEKDAEL